MRAGALRDRIVIEQLSTAKDSYGASSTTWLPFATIWADVVALSGRELIAAQAAQSETAYTFSTRYLKGVVAKMRIRWAGKLFNIESVRDPDGYRRELVIDCRAGVVQ